MSDALDSARPPASEGRDCLDDTTVIWFLDHRLSSARAAGVEAHIDRCPACRRLLSALARGA